MTDTIRPLDIAGAWIVTPIQHGGAGRLFLELYRTGDLAAVVGADFQPAQVSVAVSPRGLIRGIHYTATPPGQTKIVTCVAGAVFDVVVDLRVGSATFGRSTVVRLDDVDRRALFLPPGVGHGYCVLSAEATLLYLVSPAYQPQSERQIHPLDGVLGIRWPVDEPALSPRDSTAPTLTQAEKGGLLPMYADCDGLAVGR